MTGPEQAVADRLDVLDMETDLAESALERFAQGFATRGRGFGGLAAAVTDDAIDEGQAVAIDRRIFALAQHRQRQHVGPGLFQQGADQRPRLVAADMRRDRRDRGLAGRFELLAPTRGIDMAALRHFRFPGLGLQVAGQVAQDLFEHLGVVLEFGQHAVDRTLHLLDQLAVVVAFIEPIQAALRDRIQQLPGRMRALAEEALVAQCHAQQRHLQLGHQLRHGRVRIAVLGQVFVEQADQVDGVGVFLVQARDAAFRGDLAQLVQHVLLDVLHRARDQLAADRQRHGRLLLQHAEHRLQVIAARGEGVRVRRRRGAKPERLATPGEQFAHRLEHLLIDRLIAGGFASRHGHLRRRR